MTTGYGRAPYGRFPYGRGSVAGAAGAGGLRPVAFFTVGVSGAIWKFTPPSTWAAITSGITSDLVCVHGTDDGSFILAGGETGVIISSVDGGDTWSAPMSTPAAWNVNGLWVFSAIDAWAVVDDGAGTGGAWHWNGSSWIVSHTQANGNWYGIFGISPLSIYVCSGASGATNICHWNGSSWINDSAAQNDPAESVVGKEDGSLIYVHHDAGGASDDLYEGVYGGWALTQASPVVRPSRIGPGLWVDSTDKLYMCGQKAGNYGVIKSWDGTTLDVLIDTEPTNNLFAGIYGVSDDSILVVSYAGSGVDSDARWWDGTDWNLVTIPASIDLRGVWGIKPLTPEDITNPSFEILGDSIGEASAWAQNRDYGAQDIGPFEGSILPYEEFEAGWQSGNQLSKSTFDATDLTPATFNDSTAEVEDFNYEWKRPVTKRRILFSNVGRTSPGYTYPNDPFLAGTLYRDLDTGGRAEAEEKIGLNTVKFTYVDFVQPVEIVGAGFAHGPPPPPAANTGHLLADLFVGRKVIGTGDGIDRTFSNTTEPSIHPKQTARQATFHMQATIGGSIVDVYDDGDGNLTGDALDDTLPNTIIYTTGVVTVGFATAPDADTEIVAMYDYGQTRTGRVAEDTDPNPFISVVTRLEPSTGNDIPPYNHSSIDSFQSGNLHQAEFGGTEQAEQFESAWDLPLNSGGDCANSKAAFTSTDITAGTFDTAADAFEDFEQEWDVSFGGNETSQSVFDPGDLSVGTFDSGANNYENFEGSWITQVQA